MPANDGQQRSGAGTQPGGTTAPRTAVPNYPKSDKTPKTTIPTPSFPTGNTATHK